VVVALHAHRESGPVVETDYRRVVAGTEEDAGTRGRECLQERPSRAVAAVFTPEVFEAGEFHVGRFTAKSVPDLFEVPGR